MREATLEKLQTIGQQLWNCYANDESIACDDPDGFAIDEAVDVVRGILKRYNMDIEI